MLRIRDTGEELKLNEPVADRYVALLEQLRTRYKIDSGLDVRTLATLPDVFTWEHSALSDEETWGLVRTLVEKACDNMNAMKSTLTSAQVFTNWVLRQRGDILDPLSGGRGKVLRHLMAISHSLCIR